MRTLAILLLIVLVCAMVECKAQDEVVFKVYKRSIQLMPEVDTLLADRDYTFIINGNERKKITAYAFAGSSIRLVDSALYVHTGTSTRPRRDTLRFYTGADGKFKKVFEKAFRVLTFEEERQWSMPIFRSATPLFYWYATLMNGDTIGAERVRRAESKLTISTSPRGERKVAEFDLQFDYRGKIDSFHVVGDEFGRAVAKRVANLQAGTIITISQIKYMDIFITQDLLGAGPFKIYVKN